MGKSEGDPFGFKCLGDWCGFGVVDCGLVGMGLHGLGGSSNKLCNKTTVSILFYKKLMVPYVMVGGPEKTRTSDYWGANN